MANGKRRQEWDHTARLLAMIECVGSLGKAGYNPAKHHPFADKKMKAAEPAVLSAEESAANWAALAIAFNRGLRK